MNFRMVRTQRGVEVRVLEIGDTSFTQLVFLHGVLGLLDDNRFLEQLAAHFHVFAPELPGYGASTGEDLLEDMLDFTLHGLDVLEELHLHRPILLGHSLGGMIAAEMACLAPTMFEKLILVSPFGIWVDEYPVPDLFSLLPFEFGDLFFDDSRMAAQLLPGASDIADPESLRQFVIDTTRQLGTAGKLLFPIPNRRLAKRIYRLRTPTLLAWGEQDRLMRAGAYAARWQSLLPHAETVTIADAGHMLPYEQPRALANEIMRFGGSPVTLNLKDGASG